MRRLSYTYNNTISRNPVIQVLGLLGAVAVLTVAVVVGAFVLAALFGLALIAALVLYVRIWWLRRQWRRRAAERQHHAGGAADQQYSQYQGRIIEGEFVREEVTTRHRQRRR